MYIEYFGYIEYVILVTTIYVQVRGEMWGTPVSLAEAATAGTCPVCQVNHTCFLFAGFFGQNCHGSPCQILAVEMFQDSFSSPCKLACSHLFCSQCLYSWMQRRDFSYRPLSGEKAHFGILFFSIFLPREQSCPLCRATVNVALEWGKGKACSSIHFF